MKKLYGCLLLLILVATLATCNKDEPLPKVTDPQKAILGKWEITADTHGPIRYPGSYVEYRADSILFDYVSEDDFSYSRYWLVEPDSLLYKSHIYIDAVSGDTILVDVQAYKYEFITYNKLKLDWQQLAVNPTHIYKRIK